MEKISLLQITNNLKEFCENTDNLENLITDKYNSKYLTITENKSFKMNLPFGLKHKSDNDKRFFFGREEEYFNLNYPLSESYLTSFPNSKLVTNSYILISHDNYVIKPSYFNDQVLFDTNVFMQNSLNINIGNGNINIPFVLNRSNKKAQFIDKEMLLIPYYWHSNYHHWFLECITKLKYIFDYPEFKNVMILLPENLNNFQKESLEILNIPQEKIYHYNGDSIQVAKIYLPSISNFCHEDINWLKKMFLEKNNIEPKPEKLIYISRQDASQRRVTNEKEIFELLEKKGFEFHTLSNMSLINQIKLFSQAKIVISSHGAGLTNIIFSSPETSLVEIIPNDTVNHCFWLLSNTSNNKYSYIVADQTLQNRDILISKDKLESFLSKNFNI